MAFSRGEAVEVCSQEEGFVGSYFEADVRSRHGDGSYSVRYKNLLEEDESEPLTETVREDELRPLPPRLSNPRSGFCRADIVDAFENDGWWVGEVTGREGDLYSVYFHMSSEEHFFPAHKLRRHVEWVGGRWVASRRQDSMHLPRIHPNQLGKREQGCAL